MTPLSLSISDRFSDGYEAEVIAHTERGFNYLGNPRPFISREGSYFTGAGEVYTDTPEWEAGLSGVKVIFEAKPFDFSGDYSMESLIERAVKNARPHCYGKLPRWVGVRDTFCYGSTTSANLCRHFGLDPWEEVEGCYSNEDREE